jgi:short-subunit dehydrogenase
MSSMAGVIAPPGLATYGASKAGLSHFTAGLRADLRDTPLTFTTVHLGSVKTDMDDEARSYGPLRQLAEQSAGRDITPMADFVRAVVRAVETDREEVRVPRAMAPLAGAVNLPRRISRLIFARSMVKELRSDP